MFFTMTMLLVFCVKIAPLTSRSRFGPVARGEERERLGDALRGL